MQCVPFPGKGSSDLFHNVTELQRQRVEAELELRQIETEINQCEFTLNRYIQKLQVLKETIVQTEQEMEATEKKIILYTETFPAQEAATTKLKANLETLKESSQKKKDELNELKAIFSQKLAEWRSTVRDTIDNDCT